MTRHEQLEFCKICQKKFFDYKRGILCSLSNEYADFEKECPNFELDESIKALDTFKKEYEAKKKKKIQKPIIQKKIRVKEEFRKADWFLLFGFAFLAVFIFRVISYSQFSYSSYFINLNFYIIFFTTIILAVFSRNNKQDRNYFFSDIKFKLILSTLITVINLLYTIIILSDTNYTLGKLVALLIILNFIGLLSSIIIIPTNIIVKKIKHA